jgi:hypothetical protein
MAVPLKFAGFDVLARQPIVVVEQTRGLVAKLIGTVLPEEASVAEPLSEYVPRGKAPRGIFAPTVSVAAIAVNRI